MSVALAAALGGFALILAASAMASHYQASVDQRTVALDAAYQGALSALDDERVLEGTYLRQPAADSLAAHAAAGAALVTGLDVLEANDATLDPQLLADARSFVQRDRSLGETFSRAADAGNLAGARAAHEIRRDPAFRDLQDRFVAAVNGGRAEALAQLNASRSFSQWLLGATVTAAAVAIGFVFLLWRMMRRFESVAAASAARELELVRASEERFRALIQDADDVITILDRQGATQYASASAARLWAPLGHGGRILELLRPDDVPIARAQFAEAVTAAGATVRTELRMRAVDGSRQVTKTVGSPVRPETRPLQSLTAQFTAARSTYRKAASRWSRHRSRFRRTG